MKNPATDPSARLVRGKNVWKRKHAPRQASKQVRLEKSVVRPNGAVRLRAMIEASADSVITIDAQSTILEFNAAAERTFGYQRDEVIGKPLTESIIPPSMRESHRRWMAKLLKGGSGRGFSCQLPIISLMAS
jgi:PAS domain-containing protein